MSWIVFLLYASWYSADIESILTYLQFGVLGPTAGPHTFNVNKTASATSEK